MRILIRFTLLLALCDMVWLSYHRLFPPEPIWFEFPELEPQSLPRVYLPRIQAEDSLGQEWGYAVPYDTTFRDPAIFMEERIQFPIYYLGPTIGTGYLQLNQPIDPNIFYFGDLLKHKSVSFQKRRWEAELKDSLTLAVDTTQILFVFQDNKFIPQYPVFLTNNSTKATYLGSNIRGKGGASVLDLHALDLGKVATHLHPRTIGCSHWPGIWLPPQHMAVTTIPVFQSDYFKRYYLSTSYDPCDESVPRSNLF